MTAVGKSSPSTTACPPAWRLIGIEGGEGARGWKGRREKCKDLQNNNQILTTMRNTNHNEEYARV